MSYQVNFKLSFYDIKKDDPIDKDDFLRLANEQSRLHEEVMKLIFYRYPELRNRVQICMGNPEIVFLRD